MSADPTYVKAIRYNSTAQAHNWRTFHRQMVKRPWNALAYSIGMSGLGAVALFNWVDGPGWHRHPWMGWLLGGIAFVISGYFLAWALGWQGLRPRESSIKD